MQVQCIINADPALSETMLEACANFGLRLALQKQHFDVASWILSRRDNTATALKKVLTDLLLSDVPVQVATFQWLLDFTMDEESFVRICSVACFAGALDLCKWLHSRDLWLRHHVPVLWPSEVRERVRRACQAGKMEMVSWVCEVHDVTDTTVCDLGYAIASGSEEVCHWVLSHLADSLTDSDIECVSSLGFRGGNVPCLQWWLEVPGVLDTLKKCGVMLPYIARQSFQSGVLAPVEFVYEYFAGQGVQLTNTDSSPYLWPASHLPYLWPASHLDLIQWVATTMVPNNSLLELHRQIRPEVLRWLLENDRPVTSTCLDVLRIDSTLLESVQLICEVAPVPSGEAADTLFMKLFFGTEEEVEYKSAKALPVIRWLSGYLSDKVTEVERHVHRAPKNRGGQYEFVL
jgi:hypothetical protein